MSHRSESTENMDRPDPVISSAQEERLYSRVAWRVLPVLFFSYVLSYLDRVNIGFAKLTMLQDLGFSDKVYGAGAGIFFIGYFLFEVPSNIILHRVGARRWIARIMVSWGLISGAMMLVHSAQSFYALRFLLGLAEAGFFPGIILYLTYWFPAHRRARIVTLFMAAVPVSGILGGPLSGWILKCLAGVGNLAGWQWMFLLEALPTIAVGLLVWSRLDDRIGDARWLSDAERKWLSDRIELDAGQRTRQKESDILRQPLVWVMAAIYFGLVMGLYGIGFWLPTLIQATGVKDTLHIGVLTALPNLAALLVMVPVGASGDRRAERRWHVAIPALLGAAGLLASTVFQGNTALALVALTLATVGIISSLPQFWSLPTAVLGGGAAAAGIALINSLGNLAGYVSPNMVGWLKEQTASTASGMYLLAAALTLAALLTLSLPARLVNR